MFKISALVLWGWLCVACADTANKTAVVVRVEADDQVKASMTQLELRVSRQRAGGWDSKLEQRFPLAKDFVWPAELPIIASDDPKAVIEVVAAALDADANVLTSTRAVVTYVEGQVSALALVLEQACHARAPQCPVDLDCHGATCGSCRAGVCVSAGNFTLVPYDKQQEVRTLFGSEQPGGMPVGGSDAGAGFDGGQAHDAASADALVAVVCDPKLCAPHGHCDAQTQLCVCDANYAVGAAQRCVPDVCQSDHDGCDDLPDACLNDDSSAAGFVCSCPKGYSGAGLGSSGCSDDDECADNNPCGDQGTCQNTPGAYACTCSEGYEDTGVTCVDKHECDSANGGCAQTCVDELGSYHCECAKGSYLEADGHACRTPAWGKAELLQAAISGNPRIAMDAAGNAFAVWAKSDGTHVNLWGSRYVVGATWGSPVKLETSDAGDVLAVDISMDAVGNALVVFIQSDGTHNHAYGKYFASATGWQDAVQLETAAEDSGEPTVALSDNGSGIAIWTRTFDAYVARFVTGVGWGSSDLLQHQTTGSIISPSVGIDSQGRALAVWYRSNGQYGVVANHYEPGVGWGATASAIDVPPTGTGKAMSSALAMNKQGAGLASWVVDDRVWTNRYQPGGGWGSAELVDGSASTGQVLEPPKPLVDVNGNSSVIWSDFGSSSKNQVFVNRAPAGGGGFAGVLPLQTDVSLSYVGTTSLAADDQGQTFALWRQGGTSLKVWAKRWDPSGQLIDDGIVYSVSGSPLMLYSQLVARGAARAVAVFSQSANSATDVWTIRYE